MSKARKRKKVVRENCNVCGRLMNLKKDAAGRKFMICFGDLPYSHTTKTWVKK